MINKEILLKHSFKYKEMTLQDIYKLLYQSYFGPQHFIADESQAFKAIFYEAKNNVMTDLDDIEISDEYMRVSLKDEYNFLIRLSHYFYLSINQGVIDINGFNSFILENKNNVCEIFKIDGCTYDFYFNELKQNNYPTPSHSEIYKKLYNPHYRIIKKEYIKNLFKGL